MHGTWIEERRDGRSLPYYWLRFGREPAELTEGTDIHAVRNGFVSVTPLQLDLTAHKLKQTAFGGSCVNQQTKADRDGFAALMRAPAAAWACHARAGPGVGGDAAARLRPRPVAGRGVVGAHDPDSTAERRWRELICRLSVIAALHIEPGHRVLEVGTGSGFTAAILARMSARVVTVERFRTLAEDARKRLEALGIFNVVVKHADGSGGRRPRRLSTASSSGPPSTACRAPSPISWPPTAS